MKLAFVRELEIKKADVCSPPKLVSFSAYRGLKKVPVGPQPSLTSQQKRDTVKALAKISGVTRAVRCEGGFL